MVNTPTTAPEVVADAESSKVEGVAAETKDDAAEALRKKQESDLKAAESKHKKDKEVALVTSTKKRETASGDVEQSDVEIEEDAVSKPASTEPAAKPKAETADSKTKSNEEKLKTEVEVVMASKEFKELSDKAKKEDLLKTKLEEIDMQDLTKDEKAALINDTIKKLSLSEGKAPDKNGSIFSKSRWSSIAEGLAKEMIREEKKEKKDDSFFAGYGNKLRYWGLRIISYFGATSWYAEVCKNDEYKNALIQKFGINDADEDGVPEFGDVAGTEIGDIKNYIACEELSEALFGKKENIFEGVDPLNKPDLTFEQFQKALSDGTGIPEDRKEKYKQLEDAMLKQSPPPAGTDKVLDYIGKHADGIAVKLDLADKIINNKNDESITHAGLIVGTPIALSDSNTKFEYTKLFKSSDGVITENAFVVKNDLIKIGDIEYKTPEGTTIKSLTGVQLKSEDPIKLEVIINFGGADHKVENFLEILTDSTSELTLKSNGGEIKLEAAKPATEEETASDESAAPAAAVVAATPAPEVVPVKTPIEEASAAITAANSTTDLMQTPFEFNYPVTNADGTQSKVNCSLKGYQLTIGEKKFFISYAMNGLDAVPGPMEIKEGNIVITDIGFAGFNKSEHKTGVDKFAEVVEKLRISDDTQILTLENKEEMKFTKV